MIVAVDGYDWSDRPTGVGRFLQNLLPALLAEMPRARFLLFHRPGAAPAPAAANLQAVELPQGHGYAQWQNLHLARAVRRHHADVLFAPNNHLPLFPGARAVLTVHDIAWRAVPGDFSRRERIGKGLKFRLGLGRADRIAAVSEFTAAELVRFYGRPSAPVSVIPHGIEPRFRPAAAAEVEAFRRKYGLRGRRLLGFLGTLFPRRHVREMLQAFALLAREWQATLLVVGRNEYGLELAPLLEQPDLVHLPWLEESEINAFYSSLDLFLYLSAYEGFGLPPMEALCCGTVPLLLDGSSLREIYSDCALFIDSAAPRVIADRIDGYFRAEAVLGPHLLSAWEARRSRYTWQGAAQAYRVLLSGESSL